MFLVLTTESLEHLGWRQLPQTIPTTQQTDSEERIPRPGLGIGRCGMNAVSDKTGVGHRPMLDFMAPTAQSCHDLVAEKIKVDGLGRAVRPKLRN